MSETHFVQLQVTPSLPTPSEPRKNESSTSGESTPSDGSLGINPSLPGSSPAPTISPQLPSNSSPTVSPQLPGGSPGIAPSLPGSTTSPGVDTPTPQSDSGGIGFGEIFIALVAAFLLTLVIRRRSGGSSPGINARQFIQRNGVAISAYLLTFTMGWIVFMIVLPQLYMLDFSFRHNLLPMEIGGPKDVYTLKNYTYLLFGREGGDELLNWLHLEVFIKTILASVIVTILNFLLCYPLAFFMAQTVKGRGQRLLFLCLLLPFWVNEILRAFAFKLIFAELGLVNTFLVGIGILDQPYDFLGANVALYTGLTYAYILLMIFPLYNAIESLDHNQIEAARDMGASWLKIHLRVVMPHAKPGIASGCTMVFMLTAGALAAPNILGGPSSLWFTQIIYQWYNTGGNWPQGSAYAFVLLLSCIIFVRIMMRLFKVGLGDIAQR